MLGEVVSGLSLFDRIVKYLKRRKKLKEETVTSRFIKLFENHGVHRNQIPRFFGYGLSIADFKDEQTLLPNLTEETLDAACDMFAVRREWLDGAETQVHPYHDFYKYPLDFDDFLKSLKQKNPNGRIKGMLLVAEDKGLDDNALLILQETIDYLGEKPIFRFHICNNWSFTYWKSRVYLTACIALALKHDHYINGKYTTQDIINTYAYGECLMGWDGEGIWHFGHKDFYPDDMALQPELFLKGIDPEKNNHGLKSALQLWLELDEKGLMDAGYGPTRESFLKELEKYNELR